MPGRLSGHRRIDFLFRLRFLLAARMLSTRFGYGRPARLAAAFADLFSDDVCFFCDAPLGAARFHGALADVFFFDVVFFVDDRVDRFFAGIVTPALRWARVA